MAQYVCSICGYVHDEAQNGLFAQLPDQWVCPLCKASKSAFASKDAVPAPVAVDTSHVSTEKNPLTALEKSILCSNLARGCEKQYLPEEAAYFTQLANYFKSTADKADQGDMETLLLMSTDDLEKYLPLAMAVAKESHDRGAMRALTWCTRVTGMVQSLAEQYGGQTLEDTGVYVCTICGFVYVGNQLPALCPVCKVPKDKFQEIEGGRGL